MKKYYLGLFIFVLISHETLWCSSEPLSEGSSSEYLSPIKILPKNQYMQLAVFIDKSESKDSPWLTRGIGAVTKDFEQALLTTKNTPIPISILTTESLLLNYVSRLNDPQTRNQLSDIFNINDFFYLYSLRTLNLDLVLLVPKTIDNPFNTTNLFLFTTSETDVEDVYLDLEKKIKLLQTRLNAGNGIFDPQKLRSLFSSTDSDLVWNIWMSGHGTDDEKQIAGITPKQLQELLNFFNTTIYTKAMYINSCFLGGHQIALIDFEKAIQDRYLSQLTFILIVNGVSHDWVQRSENSSYLYNFFDQAQGSEGFSKLMETLTNTRTLSNPSIPQIWLPGGVGFQTFNFSAEVLSIGPVKNLAAFINKIPIQNKRISNTTGEVTYQNVILVYPEHLQANLELYPLDGEYKTERRAFAPTGWYVAKIINEKIESLNISERNGLSEILENFPINKSQFQDRFTFDMLTEASAGNRLFPRIIPMTQSRNLSEPNEPFIKRILQKINSITLLDRADTSDLEFDNQINPFKGIMQFLTDAFVPLPNVTEQTYLLKSLTGLNDISLWLELIRKLNTLNTNPLTDPIKIMPEADNLNASKIDFSTGKQITITHVQLSFYTYSDETGDFVLSVLKFNYENTAYEIVLRSKYEGIVPTKYIIESLSSSDLSESSADQNLSSID